MRDGGRGTKREGRKREGEAPGARGQSEAPRARHDEGAREQSRASRRATTWQGHVENIQKEGEKKSIEKKKEGESEKMYTICRPCCC